MLLNWIVLDDDVRMFYSNNMFVNGNWDSLMEDWASQTALREAI